METEQERLRALEELAVLDTPAEERFDRVTRLAQGLFDVPMATVTLVDRDRLWFKSVQGAEVTELPRTGQFCDTAIREPDTFVVEDASADERFASNPVVAHDGIRFYAGHPLTVHGGQRVGTLCLFDTKPRSLSRGERSLLADLARWVEKELTLTEELDRAAEVQRGLLPQRPPVLDGWSVAGACLPSRAVGGDFYDWYPVQDGLAVTVGDVMGKGMPAAIITATVRAVLRSASRRGDVAQAMEVAAGVLEDDLQETASFVTLFHARVRPEDGCVEYSDAGHGLAMVVRADGAVERLRSDGFPLGAVPGAAYAAAELQLQPGDLLVAASDGVLDLVDDGGSPVDRAVELVRSCASPEELVTRVRELARRQAPPDDVTVVAVQRRAA